MTDLAHTHTDMSPFDAIKRTRPDGSEFWSARDLAPLLGYDQWRNFVDVIERASQSIADVGMNPDDHVALSSKMVEIGSGAQREVADFDLTRYGAYMVTLACDSRGKPQVSAAKSYFAVKTREAEAATEIRAIPRTYAEALRAAADAEERADAEAAQRAIAEAKIAEDAPKVDLAENYLAAKPNGRLVREVAKQFELRERDLRVFLLDEKLIFARQGLCGSVNYDFYAQFAAHFESRDTTVRHAWGDCQHSTLYVTPRGVELIRRRLEQHRKAVGGGDSA